MRDFVADLLGAAQEQFDESNIFLRHLRRGEYAVGELAVYGIRLFHLASEFSERLALLLSVCPEPQLRLHIMENLLEEEGMTFSNDGTLCVDPEKRHTTLAKKFTRALGIPDGQLPAVPRRLTWLDQTLHGGRWLAASSYLMVGIESNVPRMCRIVIPALQRHYGFSEEALCFFTEHLIADEQHGVEGAKVIASLSRSPAEKEEALEGARRGAVAWQWFHRSCHFNRQAQLQ